MCYLSQPQEVDQWFQILMPQEEKVLDSNSHSLKTEKEGAYTILSTQIQIFHGCSFSQ